MYTDNILLQSVCFSILEIFVELGNDDEKFRLRAFFNAVQEWECHVGIDIRQTFQFSMKILTVSFSRSQI